MAQYKRPKKKLRTARAKKAHLGSARWAGKNAGTVFRDAAGGAVVGGATVGGIVGAAGSPLFAGLGGTFGAAGGAMYGAASGIGKIQSKKNRRLKQQDKIIAQAKKQKRQKHRARR